MLNDNYLLVVLLFFLISILLEFITLKITILKHSVYFGCGSVLFGMFAGSALFTYHPSLFSLIVLIIGFYRALNTARYITGRMHKKHLQRVTNSTFWYLSFSQAAVIGAVLADKFYFEIENELLIGGILALSLVWGLLCLWQAMAWYVSSKPKPLQLGPKADEDLPTVSLLIPARNETADLTEAINCALSSDYPKLEILVLDDCSQDKTPDIIKSYAHAGVRFIGGDKIKNNWLAKNQAYQKLADEATGDILLFTGVDTRLGPEAISYGVRYMLANKISMLSVMPLRYKAGFEEIFFQPNRYWLEFVGSKLLINKTPVLSTCWFIEKDRFVQLGQMNGLTRAIVPEEYFAKVLSKINNYSFLRANNNLNVATQKTLNDQFNTALRTRYPLFKKRPELIALVSILSLIFIFCPIMLATFGWYLAPNSLALTATFACLVLASSHILIYKASTNSKWWLSLVNFPVVVCLEIGLINISMYRYEFGRINWKGRNICQPIMHVAPSLPKLPE